jgi:hypothetical protein
VVQEEVKVEQPHLLVEVAITEGEVELLLVQVELEPTIMVAELVGLTELEVVQVVEVWEVIMSQQLVVQVALVWLVLSVVLV